MKTSMTAGPDDLAKGRSEHNTRIVSAKCSATQHVDVPRQVSRQEVEGAFMDFGKGFITEADLRLAPTKMGAELTDEEVSDLVRVVREAGDNDDNEGECVGSVSDRHSQLTLVKGHESAA